MANQNVGVTGSNFQSALTVDVFNGSGTLIANLSGTQILSQAANSFTMVINFNGNAGSYGIEVITPRGQFCRHIKKEMRDARASRDGIGTRVRIAGQTAKVAQRPTMRPPAPSRYPD